MATSLLHALLGESHGFKFEDVDRLDGVTQRLLVNELYNALMTDPTIMPLLVEAILLHRGNQDSPMYAMFRNLAARIGADFDQISRP